jgi:catechol 2,3-dioxygenase-like lactoylglutathione lyase family enzyme
MIIGFHHPGLVVSDLEVAKRFYTEALGFEYIREYGWDAMFINDLNRVVDYQVFDDSLVLELGSGNGAMFFGPVKDK